MNGIFSLLLVLAAAGCASGQPRATDVPPPCAPDVAARARTDGTLVRLPSLPAGADVPYAPGAAADTVRLDVIVAADGWVLPQTLRVTGTDDPEYLRSARVWARRQRWIPAMVGGCAIDHATNLTIIPLAIPD